MTFRSILCPVDFSVHSRHALQHAAAVAQRCGGRTAAIFVADPLLLAATNASPSGRGRLKEITRFTERTKAELARFVEQSLKQAPAAHDEIAIVVSVGNPADEILRTARKLRSDLIVMGTEGLTGVQRLFFGTTTEQVLRRSTVPVLAIPPSRRRGHRAAPMTVERVLAPIDLAGEWESDAIRAAEIARAFDATLVLIHVLAPVQRPPWLARAAPATGRERRDKAVRALERVRARFFADLQSTSHVLVGNPAGEIARMTRGGRSLVVMSLRGTGGIWGARRGSIAYRVVAHASTPVLALPRRRIGGTFRARLARAYAAMLTERDRLEIAGIDALLSAGSGGEPSETRRR